MHIFQLVTTHVPATTHFQFRFALFASTCTGTWIGRRSLLPEDACRTTRNRRARHGTIPPNMLGLLNEMTSCCCSLDSPSGTLSRRSLPASQFVSDVFLSVVSRRMRGAVLDLGGSKSGGSVWSGLPHTLVVSLHQVEHAHAEVTSSQHCRLVAFSGVLCVGVSGRVIDSAVAKSCFVIQHLCRFFFSRGRGTAYNVAASSVHVPLPSDHRQLTASYPTCRRCSRMWSIFLRRHLWALFFPFVGYSSPSLRLPRQACARKPRAPKLATRSPSPTTAPRCFNACFPLRLVFFVSESSADISDVNTHKVATLQKKQTLDTTPPLYFVNTLYAFFKRYFNVVVRPRDEIDQ